MSVTDSIRVRHWTLSLPASRWWTARAKTLDVKPQREWITMSRDWEISNQWKERSVEIFKAKKNGESMKSMMKSITFQIERG